MGFIADPLVFLEKQYFLRQQADQEAQLLVCDRVDRHAWFRVTWLHSTCTAVLRVHMNERDYLWVQAHTISSAQWRTWQDEVCKLGSSVWALYFFLSGYMILIVCDWPCPRQQLRWDFSPSSLNFRGLQPSDQKDPLNGIFSSTRLFNR